MEKENRKRKVSCLTIDVKRQILAEVDEGKISKTDICKKHEIPKSTLSTYIKNRDKIENADCTPDRKRQRVVKNEDLEKALFTWFKQARAMPLPVVGPTLCSKEEEIAKSLGVD